MMLSPNPTSEVVNLEFEEMSEQHFIQFFDMQGRLVKQQYLNGSQDVYSLQVYELPVGSYIVISVDKEGKPSREIMVIKR